MLGYTKRRTALFSWGAAALILALVSGPLGARPALGVNLGLQSVSGWNAQSLHVHVASLL
jgi:hypothetical protein